MRASISLTALISLALGLAACSDDGGGSPTTNVTNQTGTDPTGTATDPAGTTTDPGTTTDTPTSNPTTTGDDASAGTTTDPGTTTDAATTTTNTTATTTDGPDTTTGNVDTTNTTGNEDTTTGGGADPNWPAPDPMNAMMPCEAGFEPASFSMGGVVCSPMCDKNMCPEGASGDAQPACVFNPTSSGMECMMGDMCETEGEMCVQTGGGGMACLAPPSHCVLLCTDGETCPNGMECFDDLVCQYPV